MQREKFTPAHGLGGSGLWHLALFCFGAVSGSGCVVWWNGSLHDWDAKGRSGCTQWPRDLLLGFTSPQFHTEDQVIHRQNCSAACPGWESPGIWVHLYMVGATWHSGIVRAPRNVTLASCVDWNKSFQLSALVSVFRRTGEWSLAPRFLTFDNKWKEPESSAMKGANPDGLSWSPRIPMQGAENRPLIMLRPPCVCSGVCMSPQPQINK